MRQKCGGKLSNVFDDIYPHALVALDQYAVFTFDL